MHETEIHEKILKITEIALQDTPLNLKQSILYSLESLGKKIRPRILLSVSEMLNLPLEIAAPAAFSIEMIHTFTLIHDDLPCMDNSDYRRGRLANHKKFSESLALLAGDSLLTMSFEVFQTTPIYPAILLKAFEYLLQCIGPSGVVGGQAAEQLLNAQSSLEDLLKMHEKKTSALFNACTIIPGIFAQSSTEVMTTLKELAHSIGYIFQIADDLEDQEYTPTSILYYWDKETAQKACYQKLEYAQNILHKAKLNIQPLEPIFNELQKKIASPLPLFQ